MVTNKFFGDLLIAIAIAFAVLLYFPATTAANKCSHAEGSPCFDRGMKTQMELNEGDFAVLVCRVYDADEGASVTWHGPQNKDGIPLPIDDDIFWRNEKKRFSVDLTRSMDQQRTPRVIDIFSTLVIDFTHPNDSGHYTCSTTQIKHIFSYSLKVKRSKTRDNEAVDYGNGRMVLIKVPPYVPRGTEATLKCKALVNPVYKNNKFSVDWYKDGRPVITSWPRITISKSFDARRIVVDHQGTQREHITELGVELHILNASQYTDTGLYQCKTSHMEGLQKIVDNRNMPEYYLNVRLRRRDFLALTTSTARPPTRPPRRPYNAYKNDKKDTDNDDYGDDNWRGKWWWEKEAERNREIHIREGPEQGQTQNDGSSSSQASKSSLGTPPREAEQSSKDSSAKSSTRNFSNISQLLVICLLTVMLCCT